MFPPDLLPVKNKALYAYRVAAKWFSFFYFGLSSLILAILVIPVMRLFLHPKTQFQKYGRRFVSSSMSCFVSLMHFIGIVDLEAGDKKNYRNLSSKIIVANHPSLLDVVMLLSLISNVDCIVNASLSHGILRGIVRQLYILNSMDLEGLMQKCKKSLKLGNCLIIFPEGTRTPRTGKVILKKGAARIALATGYAVVPVHIGGTDKYGLGKKEPWTGFNPNERYVYRISMGAEIKPEKYLNLPAPAAARILTNEISAFLFPEKEADINS